jgi:hypothetical protein
MRSFLMFLSCLVCFVSSYSFACAQEQRKEPGSQSMESLSWTKVAPTTGGFIVLMPGTPKEKASDIGIGPMKVPTTSYSLNLGEAGFFVQRWGDFPKPLVKVGLFDALFDSIHRVFFETKEADGKISSMPFTRTNISLNGNAGYEYQAACGPYKKVSGPCSTTIRVYKVGRSLFIIGSSGPKSAQSDEVVEKFFSSFTLIQ